MCGFQILNVRHFIKKYIPRVCVRARVYVNQSIQYNICVIKINLLHANTENQNR